LRGIGIERRCQELHAARTIFVLKTAQNLRGFLTVRTGGRNEGEHHYFARILAQQSDLAVRHFDSKLARRTRHLLSVCRQASQKQSENR